MTTLLGLDLSTRAAAAVAVPLDWAGDWTVVNTTVAGEALHKGATEAERIGRCRRVAEHLASFASEHGVCTVFVESYAYGQATAAHSLGELGGIVRLALLDLGLDLHVANMSSARKLMCGTIPRSANKKAVVTTVLAKAGAPAEITEDHNVADAFVCANWGLSEVGSYCFAAEAA